MIALKLFTLKRLSISFSLSLTLSWLAIFIHSSRERSPSLFLSAWSKCLRMYLETEKDIMYYFESSFRKVNRRKIRKSNYFSFKYLRFVSITMVEGHGYWTSNSTIVRRLSSNRYVCVRYGAKILWQQKHLSHII